MLDDKIWLNNKYIKNKNQNYKLKTKFFEPFRVLYLIKKQAYKLELSKKQKNYKIFYIINQNFQKSKEFTTYFIY